MLITANTVYLWLRGSNSQKDGKCGRISKTLSFRFKLPEKQKMHWLTDLMTFFWYIWSLFNPFVSRLYSIWVSHLSPTCWFKSNGVWDDEWCRIYNICVPVCYDLKPELTRSTPDTGSFFSEYSTPTYRQVQLPFCINPHHGVMYTHILPASSTTCIKLYSVYCMSWYCISQSESPGVRVDHLDYTYIVHLHCSMMTKIFFQ